MVSKFFGFIAIAILFTALMLGIQALHFRYLTVDVVFYSALYDALAALGVIFVLMLLGVLARSWNWFERVQALAILGLAGYGFAISVPTVVDRSLSIYILEKLQQRGGAIREDAFEQIFQNEYMVEHRLVDVRLTEQVESGTVQIIDGCVRLTRRGDTIADVTRYYRQHFLPKHRQLRGELTDDLTDPFRSSAADADYACR